MIVDHRAQKISLTDYVSFYGCDSSSGWNSYVKISKFRNSRRGLVQIAYKTRRQACESFRTVIEAGNINPVMLNLMNYPAKVSARFRIRRVSPRNPSCHYRRKRLYFLTCLQSLDMVHEKSPIRHGRGPRKHTRKRNNCRRA